MVWRRSRSERASSALKRAANGRSSHHAPGDRLAAVSARPRRGRAMRRRDLLALFAYGVAHWPAVAVAQNVEPVRQIAVLIALSQSDPDTVPRVAAFQQTLESLGWVDGRNVQIHYRWSSQEDRMRSLAQELVALRPDVIIASSSIVVSVLLRETRTIPIVVVTASDPVGDGFVASLARPGGNVTGFTNSNASMGGKWLELIREVAPQVKRVAVMYNRQTAPAGGTYFLEAIEGAAASVGVRTLPTPVREPSQI